MLIVVLIISCFIIVKEMFFRLPTFFNLTPRNGKVNICDNKKSSAITDVSAKVTCCNKSLVSENKCSVENFSNHMGNKLIGTYPIINQVKIDTIKKWQKFLTGGKMFPYLIEEREGRRSPRNESPKRKAFEEDRNGNNLTNRHSTTNFSPRCQSK